MNYVDLQLLAQKGSCNELFFYNFNITDSEDLQVPLDKLIGLFPYVKHFGL